MAIVLEAPETFEPPQRSTYIYGPDPYKSWEQIVEDGPNWQGSFPPYPEDTPYQFLGQKLASPIVIAAGPAYGYKWNEFYLKMGYNVIHKTTRTRPRQSNEPPNLVAIIASRQMTRNNLHYRLTGSLAPEDFQKYLAGTNSYGNPSWEMGRWGAELAQANGVVKQGQFLACSVTATPPENPSKLHGSSLEDYAVYDLYKGVENIIQAGVQIIELNLACPNVIENPEEGEMFKSPKLVSQALAKIKTDYPNIRLGFKFGLYDSLSQMEKAFEAGGENLNFVSGINAIGAPVADRYGRQILPGRSTSGTCGWPIRSLALESIEAAANLKAKRGFKYEIIGGGGVLIPEDVDRYREVGADIVQIALIAMRDPLFGYKYHLLKQGLYHSNTY